MGQIWEKSYFFPTFQIDVSLRIFGVVSSFFHTNSDSIWKPPKWGRFADNSISRNIFQGHPDHSKFNFKISGFSPEILLKIQWKSHRRLWWPVSFTRVELPLTYRNTLQVFMPCFHLVSEVKIPIWSRILIQLGLGVNRLGMEPLSGPAQLSES